MREGKRPREGRPIEDAKCRGRTGREQRIHKQKNGQADDQRHR